MLFESPASKDKYGYALPHLVGLGERYPEAGLGEISHFFPMLDFPLICQPFGCVYIVFPPVALQYDLETCRDICNGKSNLFFYIVSEIEFHSQCHGK